MIISPEQLTSLEQLLQNFQSKRTEDDLIISGVETLITLVSDSIESDQVRIDTAIQADKEARSQEVTDLTTRAETAEASVETLTTEKENLITAHTEEVETLTQKIEELTPEVITE